VDLQRVDRFASRHRGLLSFEESGLTRAEWNRAIALGAFDARYRNVARLYGAKSTTEMRIEAAVLAAGPDALASHRSSALLWGVERPASSRAALAARSPWGCRITQRPGPLVAVDSDLEALMAEILDTFGLPKAEFHALVGGFEVDFWITDSNVVIECDGWSAHGLDHDQFEFDKVRDADLLAKGVITQRVTWRQMVRSPRSVARRIEATLAEWSPHVLHPDRRTITGQDLGATRVR
jgi:very-short-patch-repair endonuclease